MWIPITIMNSSAVHSCMLIKKCLSETKKPAPEPYPRGRNNQLISPVTLNKENKKKDITLTIHSLDSFPVISMVPLFHPLRDSWSTMPEISEICITNLPHYPQNHQRREPQLLWEPSWGRDNPGGSNLMSIQGTGQTISFAKHLCKNRGGNSSMRYEASNPTDELKLGVSRVCSGSGSFGQY